MLDFGVVAAGVWVLPACTIAFTANEARTRDTAVTSAPHCLILSYQRLVLLAAVQPAMGNTSGPMARAAGIGQ